MRCPKCGEPWDIDTLHDELSARITSGKVHCDVIGTYPSGNPRYDQDQYVAQFDKIVAEFQRNGCATIKSYAARCSKNEASPLTSVVYDLLGDDVDGAESIFDDIEFMTDFTL